MISLGLGVPVRPRSGVSGGGAVVDPLFGISSLLDLRTHKGDKVPFGIAADGFANPEWSGVVGSAAQVVVIKQPLTELAADNTPYLDFDGVDDSMPIGAALLGGVMTYTSLIKSKTSTWNSYWGILDNGLSTDVAGRWGIFSQGTTNFHEMLPTSVRVNGISAVSPFPVPTPDSWNILTVETSDAAIASRTIGALGEFYFGGFEIIALFLYDGPPTSDQIETVEDYFQTLMPA